MNNDEKILTLAKYLAEIHCHVMHPFYFKEKTNVWDKFLEQTDNEDEVDQTFFINMAKMILDKIN